MGLAGLLTVLRDPALAGKLRIGRDARVLVVNTEGATDLELYEKIVGRSPQAIGGALP